MANRIQNEHIKHTFSKDERADLSNTMAQKVTELHQAEDDKKAINSDFKSQIDGLTADVNSAATKITNGYEMRNIECEHKPDYDKKIWTVVRIDTGEPVKELPMSEEDFQMSIDDVKAEVDEKAETLKTVDDMPEDEWKEHPHNPDSPNYIGDAEIAKFDTGVADEVVKESEKSDIPPIPPIPETDDVESDKK